MKNLIKRSLLVLLATSLFPVQAAIHGVHEGWIFESVKPDTFLHFFTGGASAVMSKRVTNPERGAPSVRIYTIQTDVSKLNDSKEVWRAALIQTKKKMLIMNERFITVKGQTRYIIEYQTDSGTESMLQSAVMGVVVNGELQKFLYEYPQIVYRTEIAEIRTLYSSVDLKTE